MAGDLIGGLKRAWIDAIIRAFHEIAWPSAAAWIAWYFRDAIVAQLHAPERRLKYDAR